MNVYLFLETTSVLHVTMTGANTNRYPPHTRPPVTVCQLLTSFTFGQLLRCAHKRIMKVYIERNNMPVDLIRFRKKYRLYSRLRFEELYVYSISARWQHFLTALKVNILHQ